MHMVKVLTPVLYPVFAQGAHNAIERISVCTLFQSIWKSDKKKLNYKTLMREKLSIAKYNRIKNEWEI